jgi:peptidoglycan/LPS O-acetylase OafA/YrhL
VTSRPLRGRHLPALDGLRALAVLAVVGYHLNLWWARGGYLGVDLFFVLSGFLITSLLLEEHAADGTIRLGAFWARRGRRLLPALFVMVAAVMAFVVLEGRYGNTDLVAAIDLSQLRDQALATLGYVANWQLIATQHSYFAQFSAPSPLQHTWSLAIEEQFYLVWPFVTLVLLKWSVTSRRSVGAIVTAMLAVASTVLMAVLFVPGADPSRIYYGTDTRLADLAVGATLAWLTARGAELPEWTTKALRVAAPLAALGLVALMVTAGTAEGIPSPFMFEGGFLAASLLCAVVIADVRRDDSVLATVFSWRPLVGIGVVSYGIYLWHWPVIVFATPASTGVSGAGLVVVRLAVITALVVVSYVLVEQPVRRRRLAVRARVVLYPLGVAATVAVVFVGTSSLVVGGSFVHAELLRYSPGAVVPGAGGLEGQVPIVVSHRISRSDPLRVVLLGDSMIEVAGPGIDAALDATGEVRSVDMGFPGWGTSTISNWRVDVRDAVERTHADVVVFMTGWDGAAAAHRRRYDATMLDLISIARHAGAAGVVFLEYPKVEPSPPSLPVNDATVDDWNTAVASLASLAPGRAMFFPVAASVELDGRYSAWLPPPRDLAAPTDTWNRVRRLDGVHLCAPGIELFASAIVADAESVWHVPAPAARWWIDGWQRNPIVASAEQYCPSDHPG